MNDCNIIYITIYSSLIGLHEGAIQHKLESGYKPVKQQLSISPPHQALALSSSVSFPPLTHTSARWRCAGNRWWQGEAIFPNGPNTQQPAASQYNADLKHNKQTPTPTKIQTNSLPSSGTRSNIIAPVTDQCYRSSVEHTAPTAAAQAKGITLANRLVKKKPGINIIPGTQVGQWLKAHSSGLPDGSVKPGIPKPHLLRCPRGKQEAMYPLQKGTCVTAAAPGSVKGWAWAQQCHPLWLSPLGWMQHTGTSRSLLGRRRQSRFFFPYLITKIHITGLSLAFPHAVLNQHT